jgi:hypothetical protein
MPGKEDDGWPRVILGGRLTGVAGSAGIQRDMDGRKRPSVGQEPILGAIMPSLCLESPLATRLIVHQGTTKGCER